MKVEQLIAEAAKLSDQGFSLREIAEKLGTSKSTVGRWLQQYEKSENDDLGQDQAEDESFLEEEENDDEYTPGHPKDKNLELGKLQLSYSHKEAMADKGLKARKIELKDKEHELKARELTLREQQQEAKHVQHQQKLIQRQQTFVRRFHKLIEELLDSCQDYKWDINDVTEYLERLDLLKEAIEDFCDEELSIDYEELSIWQTLVWVEEEVSELYDRWAALTFRGRTIAFDFDDELVEELEEAMEVTDFDEVSEEEDDEDDDDGETNEEN